MWLWILVILCLNKLGIDLSGGEEHYLSYAQQWINPNWISESFVFSEYAGSRIVFQWLVGNLLQIFSFEWTTFICRFLNFILYAHALSLLFRLCKFDHLTVWFGLQLYLIVTQSFFSSAWMLISFEPKTIAYALCIYGLFFYLGHRYILGFIFIGLASYFHILVGCWLILYLSLHAILFRKQFSPVIKAGSIFILIIAPLLYYFLLGISFGENSSESNLSANQIYAYYRLPHHIGLFKSNTYFFETHFIGVVWMSLSLLTLFIVKEYLNDILNTIIEISMVIGLIVFIFILVAYLDHSYFSNSGNLFLKSYPFRGNVWIKFFAIFILAFLVMGLASRSLQNQGGTKVLITVLMVATGIQCINNLKRSFRQEGSVDRKNMLNYIKVDFPSETIFSTIGLMENDRYQLGRLLKREPFVEFKFVPAGTEKIYEWYRRCLLFDQWQNQKSLNLMANENVGIVISKIKLNNESLELTKSFGKYFVYRYIRSN